MCDPNVLMMKTAKPRGWFDVALCLRRSVERSALVKRKVGMCTVMVGAIFCQQMAKMTFAEHHDVVDALASDRPDQPST